MKKFLNQPKRTKPSAHGSPRYNAVKKQNSDYVETDAVRNCGERGLQRTERACTYGSRAGITVEAGHTCNLGFSCINIAFDKALDISIVKKGGIQLNDSSFGRFELLEVHPNPTHSAQIVMAL